MSGSKGRRFVQFERGDVFAASDALTIGGSNIPFAGLGAPASASASAPASVARGDISAFLGKPEIPSGPIMTITAERGDTVKDGTASLLSNFSGPLAGSLSVPSTVLIDGVIDHGELDGYGISLVVGQTYLFSVYGSGADPLVDTILLLVDPDGNFIEGGYGPGFPVADDDGGAGTSSLFTYTATVTGDFIIGVGGFSPTATGQYTLDAVLQPPGDVVGDTFADAAPIALGTTQYGFIDAGPGVVYGPNFGEVDTFSFTATAGMIYSFEVAGGADYNSLFFDLPPGELDTFVVIYDSAGNIVALNDDINFPGDISSRVNFFAEEGGTYFVDVFSWAPWTGGYSITSAELNPADFNPLDSVTWFNANNVPFDATKTAYVYFAVAGENFGETQGDSNAPLVSLGWNDYEKAQVMLALEEYEKILGVNYEITTDVTQATFRLITTEDEPYGAYMYPQDPTFGTQQGIAAFNVDSGGWQNFQQSLLQGGFAFAVILHEFGHGHGLSHPHDTGGGSEIMLGVTGPFDSLGIYDLNQGVYTVMSYNDAWQTHPDGPSPFTIAGIDNGWSGTLGAFDIAALQRRYGVLNPYATGNTVYQLRDTNDVGTFYQTIWDTGGIDVIRYDGVRDARIDLLAATIDYTPTGGGVISYVDDIWGGFTIAQGVVIENATGGGGNDALLGNSAANVLRGNGGDDVLVGREGGDTMFGGAGSDTASYIDADAGVTASLHDSEHNTGDAAGDRYKSVENLQGSSFNDLLTGSDGANRLDGLAGDDTLRGRDGADTLLGGAGNDNLRGDDGADVLDGGAGNDILRGDDGADVFIGGGGNDTMRGDDGADRFVFASGNGADSISDFARRADVIDLTATGLVWGDLDSNANGRLDDADVFVVVNRNGTVIDLGAADGGAAGVDTLSLTRVNGLTQSDFLFGG
ncbi:MAG TPA: hypothetical protein DHW63_00545 [Hyphomonadaceae bacterium]|nr:hypothetical protein [Hyphomonadaceae bacterium]